MGIEIIKLRSQDKAQFKRDMQQAFLRGAIDSGFCEDSLEEILPESHIERSFASEGAVAYAAMEDGQIIGGAIISIAKHKVDKDNAKDNIDKIDKDDRVSNGQNTIILA